MEFQVIYSSRNGHTQKVAESIASELGVAAEDVSEAELDPDAVIFLGSGCYGKKPSKKIIGFIEENELEDRDVALFGTSGGGDGHEVKEMEAVLLGKGANILGEFHCKGQILLINRGRPNEEDLEAARNFAKNMISET